MEHNPKMHIVFPPAKEEELHTEMQRLAQSPWAPQDCNPYGKPAGEDQFYFHRDISEDLPSCTLCIWRSEPGRWTITRITPDEGQAPSLSVEQYKMIVNEFDSKIAEPAATIVGGMSSIEISVCRLEDYFSPEAVRLLEHFCETSNQSDLGTHLDDQRRWMQFLLQAYDDGNDVHCDIFGRCLKNAECWPEEGIRYLVSEYDFAMRLLEQSGR